MVRPSSGRKALVTGVRLRMSMPLLTRFTMRRPMPTRPRQMRRQKKRLRLVRT